MTFGLRAGLAFAGALALLSVGCGNKIGDGCATSADCSQEGDRTCDLTQPGGYCTVDGCDERSCPEEAVCIRFFPRQYLSKPCGVGCAANEICLPEGQCAPRSTERRYCALACGDDSGCRGGYECRAAGEKGSVALVSDLNRTFRFCAPAVP